MKNTSPCRLPIPAGRSIAVIAISACGLTALSIAPAAHAAPGSALDFAIFGVRNVTLETYSAVHGDIYSGEDLRLDFGYGIQRPPINLGDMYAGDDYSQGSLSTVNGNVYANGSSVIEGSGAVAGTLTASPGTVGTYPVPKAAAFVPGSTHLTLNQDTTLAPGSYGDIIFSGLFDKLTFTAGNYYLNSLTSTVSATFNFDLSQGPINLYVADDIFLETYAKFEVNGAEVKPTFTPEQKALASQLLIEAHGNITATATAQTGFFGTLFAPFGDIDVDFIESYGVLIAGENIAADIYLELVPSDTLATRALVSTNAPIAGDADGDGDIDDADLAKAFSNYTGPVGSHGGKTRADGDVDRDGDVDDADLGYTFGSYTGPLGPSAPAVPEPASLTLMVMVGLLAARRRTV